MTTQLWPVYGFGARAFQREPVATFFSWGAAVDYAMRPLDHDGWEQRNLFTAGPRTRKGGSSSGNL